MESVAFSSAHVTGFFRAYEYPGDPLHTGSKGVGFSIEEGVSTQVKATVSAANRVEVEINGVYAADAFVSERVVKTFLARSRGCYDVLVKHRVGVPVGVGFGTSGAAALSLALALNEAFDTGLSRVEAAQVAHVAEVECRTGLGTVLAELQGGFEARVEPGGPGFGKILSIPVDEKYVMVALTFGRLSTELMLRKMRRKREVVSLAERLLDLFLKDRSVENFLNLCYRFTEAMRFGVKMQRVLKEAGDAGFVCGAAMFGETVFTLVKASEVDDVRQIFVQHKVEGSDILISRLEERGARLL